jgi:flagellar motility protein MotE (MotC chaperone)/sporulation protein YlmC with PRC-barrel domain
VSPSTNSIFISRIQGLPVLDAAGEQAGKLRDVVVNRPATATPPHVKGLVVELLGRRRVFVPMLRVHAIDATQVGISGVIDTRTFQQRETEALVIEDLFDRTFARPDGRSVSIFDVAMRETRSHEWELSEVALREVTGRRRFGFTQRGPVSTVPWSQVAAELFTAPQSTDAKVAQLVEMKPADVARELHDMTPQRRVEVAQALDDDQLADAFQELPEDEQVSLLAALGSERAVDVLGEMDPDDAADLIHDLPNDQAEDLLARMQPEDAEDVRQLLKYGELTAGGMMTPEPVILPPDATVADALAHARSEELTPALASMVFITRPPTDTPSGRYLGGVHIQRLLREPPSVMASGLIDHTLEPLRPEARLGEVSRYFAIYNLVVAPVVNAAGQLLGAVTVDDVLDHLLPEDWRGEQMDGEPLLSPGTEVIRD